MNRYRYITMIDPDEILIPANHDTAVELLDELFEREIVQEREEEDAKEDEGSWGMFGRGKKPQYVTFRSFCYLDTKIEEKRCVNIFELCMTRKKYFIYNWCTSKQKYFIYIIGVKAIKNILFV